MRLSYAFFFILASLFTPAIAADDQSSKQEVAKVADDFRQNFDKQNSAGIGALFTKDGVFVNPTGAHTDVAQFYEGAFKNGINQIEIAVKEAKTLGADTVIGIGEYQASGKNTSGAAIGDNGYWTAIYARDGGTLKIRMLTAFPKAPPPK